MLCPFIYIVPAFLLGSYVGTSTDLHKFYHYTHGHSRSTTFARGYSSANKGAQFLSTRKGEVKSFPQANILYQERWS